MQLDVNRMDIHMGDDPRPLYMDIEDTLVLSDLLRVILVPYVPRIRQGWTFRAIADEGPIDIAHSGGSNRSPRLLVEDTTVARLVAGRTLRIGARPTAPDTN